MADSQNHYRLKALGHQAANLDAKLDSYRALSNEDLLYRYSRVSYLFERAVERMEPSEDFMEDMNLMRVVLLDRLSTIPLLRQHRGNDLAAQMPLGPTDTANPPKQGSAGISKEGEDHDKV